MIIVKMNKLIEFTKLTPQQTIELPGCIHISISMFCHWNTFSFLLVSYAHCSLCYVCNIM